MKNDKSITTNEFNIFVGKFTNKYFTNKSSTIAILL